MIAEHRLYYLMELADRIVYLEDGEIARIFTPEEFLRLPETEREHMGLRAVDLARVLPPASHPPISSPTLALHDVTLRYKKRTILHQIALSAAKGKSLGWSVIMEPERPRFLAPCVGFIKTVKARSFGTTSRWNTRRG